MEEGENLLAEVNQRNELMTTRAALADIFWMAVGALFVGGQGRAERTREP
jgi:hypothetical protein